MIELINKYPKTAPRYTSYPPVPMWKGLADKDEIFQSLSKTVENGIDLYVHIPFCFEGCHYCGCNKIVSKKYSLQDRLVHYLSKEWSLYLERLPNIKISSIHLGGGTPNFLSPDNLDKFLSIFDKFRLPKFKASIEVDPRTCQMEHIDVLVKHGWTRISMGIQDFDEAVQKEIGRIQPFEKVLNLVNYCRASGLDDINFDLIYGLPNQNIETVKGTIEKVIQLAPESVAFYNYAHLPNLFPSQSKMNIENLPEGNAKTELYLFGRDLFNKNGYSDIGLDHFAKDNSRLKVAQNEKRLHRSFMGYTEEISEVTLGLGPSSIGYNGDYYYQNEKNLSKWEKLIDSSQISWIHGHHLSEQEKLTYKRIQSLMCDLEFSSNWFKNQNDITEFEIDNIVFKQNDNDYGVTELGKLFLRTIAVNIDPLITDNLKGFSKVH